MDKLVYNYSHNEISNKLLKVTDNTTNTFGFKDGNKTGDDYSYDANGNLTIDRNKGIDQITYNHLNLPTTVTVSGANNGTIAYVYDATGAKLKKIATEGANPTTTEYAGNYVYKNNNLEYFSTPEGYVTPENGEYKYVYQFKDHLGNVRLSYTDADNNGTVEQSEIIEESNYYPFGLKMRRGNEIVSSHGNSTAQKFKYNGIEHEQALGLDLYEMPLRQYDPAIARWTGIDPVTHHSNSTYNGFDNNPVFWADPSGASVEQIEGGYKFTGDDAKAAFKILAGNSGSSNNSENDNSSPPSTEVTKNEDGTYNVVNAEDDGDNNIYVVDDKGKRSGEIIGQTRYADEFINPENGTTFKNFILYIDAKWETILRPLAKQAEGLDLIGVANESRPSRAFDVKSFYPNQARLLGGKYATSRTAGNFLAGYNAQGATYYGVGISFVAFQKIAGSLHKKQFSTSNVFKIMFKGKTFGPKPFYGEVEYQYRASKLGWDAATYNYLSKGKSIIR